MSKKNLITLLVVLCVVLVGAVTSVIVVLVSSSNIAQSVINIQYNSDGIMADVSANYLVGSTKTSMSATQHGSSVGDTLSLSPIASAGEISPSGTITLDNNNSRVVFEFIFTNTHDSVDIKLSLTGTPSANRVKVSYITSDIALNGFDSLDTLDNFKDTLILANSTKYAYIIVEVESLMYNASYSGDIVWSLTRAVTNTVTYAGTIDTSNNASLFTSPTKFLSGDKVYESDLQLPVKTNTMFVGWYTTSDLTTMASFPITLSSDITLYPNFLTGNIPASYYYYDSETDSYYLDGVMDSSFTETSAVIPDAYNDGTHGVKKLTKILDDDDNGYGGLMSYITSSNVYIGNCVSDLGSESMSSMGNPNTNVFYVFLGRSLQNTACIYNMGDSLLNVFIPDNITSISLPGYTNWETGTTTYPSFVTNNYNKAIQYSNNTEKYFFAKANTTLTNTDNIENWDKVSYIAEYAFKDCTSLTTTNIPNSVTSIGNYAFKGCSGLTNITIPTSVTSIGTDAFQNCSSLTSITIPNSVTSIGASAFLGCSSLTSITIPNSVTSIGNYAFYGCSGLTSITIPSSVTSIGSYAFRGCSSLTSITIGNSVTSIGSYAFYGCSSLTSITIPNSVTSIGQNAFQGCSKLSSITIGNSVTSIGDYAFQNCSKLTSITIPNSVTSIGQNAFQGCSGLTSIKVNSGNTKYDSRDNCNAIIETSTNTLIRGCKNTVIPDSVTSIGSYAFYGCSSLTSITIPNSVTSIGNRAFYNCSSLTSITIPNSVTSIGNYAFQNCSKLTSVKFENTTGWKVATSNSSTASWSSVTISATDLAANATLLKSTHYSKYWKRT